jgi:glycine cleavage system aminomethyltransferase T
MLDIDELPVWALRISYVGEMGWELHFPTECGRYLWDILAETGKSFGIIPCGIGVYGTTGRIEKSYRLYGAELESSFSPVECGLARRNVKDADFIGKEAYLLEREAEPAATLCSLTVDDHRSRNGQQRFMLGGEPVLTADGKEIKDRKGRRSYVTSAGNGPSLGKHVLMTYLPPEYAEVGKQLKVEYFCEQYPVTVGVVGSTPLFDPKNEKMR